MGDRRKQGNHRHVESTGSAILDQIKDKLQIVDLRSVFPDRMAKRYQFMLKRIKVFNDEDFTDFVAGNSVLRGIPAADNQIRSEVSPMNAAYVFNDAASNGPAIGIRKRVLTPLFSRNLPYLLTEELAHSLAQVETILLSDLPAGSTALAPRGDAEQIVAQLNSSLREYGTDGNLSLNDHLALVRSGWKTYITETVSGMHYPWGSMDEIIDEETRAAIVQTALLALYQGSGKSQFDRFKDGMAKIRARLNREMATGMVTARLMAGAQVIGAYGNATGWISERLVTFFQDINILNKRDFIARHPQLRPHIDLAREYIADEVSAR